MPDLVSDLTFESPVVTTHPDGRGAALTLADESATTKTIVRADLATPAAAGLGVTFGTSRREGDTLVLGQRPREWMLLGTAEANAAFVGALDAGGSEAGGHVSVIDHTHSRALFRLSGVRAAALLEKVCSVDWSDAMSPDGAVLSASVAKVNCDVTRQDRALEDRAREDRGGTPTYLIACDRSFGQYLFDALLDAGDEFGIGVASGG